MVDVTVDPTAFVVSFNFSPGLKKEFATIGSVFEEAGYSPTYLLSDSYKHIDIEQRFKDVAYLTSASSIRGMATETASPRVWRELQAIIADRTPMHVYLYNPHPLNLVLCKLLRWELGEAVQISLYLHEPYKPDTSAYGLRTRLKFRITDWLQSRVINLIDRVLLPSKVAKERFRGKYPDFEIDDQLVPILLPDRSNRRFPASERQFFVKVGMVNRATGHDDFMRLVEASRGTESSGGFALVTSSDLPNIPHGEESIEVVAREYISDALIYDYVSRSYAVFKLDRELTQSGVVPVAFMHGTPVIARDIPGLTQHVHHRENGYVVPEDPSIDDLIDAMDAVKANFETFSQSARQDFEETWYRDNWPKYYNWL